MFETQKENCRALLDSLTINIISFPDTPMAAVSVESNIKLSLHRVRAG